MGLLEKALKYKREINSAGEETLIDRIKGPAETDIIDEDIVFLDANDLQPVSDDDSAATEVEPEEKIDESENLSGNEEVKNGDNEIAQEAQEQPGGEGTEKRDVPKIHGIDSNTDDDELKNSETEFTDFMLLYEIQKEIVRARSADELYETILFSLMGQIGTSSSSILVRDPKNIKNWVIIASKGVEIDPEKIAFDPNSGILKELFTRKEIIDIEEFKNIEELQEDYYEYISIDARLLVPLIQGFEVLGMVILGEKLTNDEYSDEDREFLNFVGEVSAISLNNINTMEMVLKVNENLSSDFGSIREADRLQEKLLVLSNIQNTIETSQQEFVNMGIEKFAVFIKSVNEDRYIPIICDKDDSISIKSEDLKIDSKDSFINYIMSNRSPIIVNNFADQPEVKELFSYKQIKDMTMLRIYPFIIRSQLLGFILVFEPSEAIDLAVIDAKMVRVSRYIVDYCINMTQLDKEETRFVDNFKIIVKRIQDEISNSKNLGIPLTLVLFSVKNYKRIYNLVGGKVVNSLFVYLEKVIKSRLSDFEFSVRYDMNKIMIILPGKDKKYSVPLASSIKNEMVHKFNKNNLDVLLTFLTAEYPGDGDNIYSLLDAVD
ncbi:GAF domain-containing protein [Spirochaetota bacterium]